MAINVTNQVKLLILGNWRPLSHGKLYKSNPQWCYKIHREWMR